MPSLTIDNRKIQVPDGTNLLEAARMAGVKIPSLCYLKNVQAIGSCRVCLVEVKGAKALAPSCVTMAGEGMEVQTNSPRARGELVFTSIPSAATVTQEGMRVLAPFTSTRHTRQDPMACTFLR